jgi:hypothetical protein
MAVIDAEPTLAFLSEALWVSSADRTETTLQRHQRVIVVPGHAVAAEAIAIPSFPILRIGA